VSGVAEYIEHVTREGERWDQLAWHYYGDPHAYERIILANPTVPITPLLPSGVMLLIPLVEETDAVSGEELPPWKR